LMLCSQLLFCASLATCLCYDCISGRTRPLLVLEIE